MFSAKHNNEVIYTGSIESEKKVCIYYRDLKESERKICHFDVGHFDFITTAKGFSVRSYYCFNCFKGYNNKCAHQCNIFCNTCQSKCLLQESEDNEKKSSENRCKDCFRLIRSDQCMLRHKSKRSHTLKNGKKVELPPLCEVYKQCRQCYKVYEKKPNKEHVCGMWHCQACDCDVLGPHTCYMRAVKAPKSTKKYIAFDFEADIGQNDFSENSCHKAVFVSAVWTCAECIDIPHRQNNKCSKCGECCPMCADSNKKAGEERCCMKSPLCGLREKVFEGENTVDEFGRWLIHPRHANTTAFAHNSQGYDAYFLMKYAMDNAVRPNVIFRGSKILSMVFKEGLNFRIIDTLSFLPMRLADMPNAFGLASGPKGYFPYLFPSDFKYKGPYPDKHFYGPDSMSTAERKKFLQWHEEKVQSQSIFDYKKEIDMYCRQDTKILMEAAMSFRREVLKITKRDGEETGIDPWSMMTIAGLCQSIYKYKFLEEHYVLKLKDGRELAGIKRDGIMYAVIDGEEVNASTLSVASSEFVKSPIVIIPPDGGHDTYSKVSIEWLEYMSERLGEKIEHGLNGREHTVPNEDGTGTYRLDGYVPANEHHGPLAFSFYGDIHHGCVKCFPKYREVSKMTDGSFEEDQGLRKMRHPYTGQSMTELYQKTKRREEYLKSLGYEVFTQWECEWKALKNNNPDLADYVAGLNIPDRLRPRDAFYGGRTNCTKLYYKTKEGEWVCYVDFTSLYPYINKYAEYIFGAPKVITKDFTKLEDYFGICYVKVLPPKGLYHPVLPLKMNGKLFFPLCNDCAMVERQTRCRCPPDKRVLTGAWATPELELAVDKGYRIVKWLEVLHWGQRTKYDPEKKGRRAFQQICKLLS